MDISSVTEELTTSALPAIMSRRERMLDSARASTLAPFGKGRLAICSDNYPESCMLPEPHTTPILAHLIITNCIFKIHCLNSVTTRSIR